LELSGKITSGGEVTPATCMTGPMSGGASLTKAFKLLLLVVGYGALVEQPTQVVNG
jgi:hypothetical protein